LAKNPANFSFPDSKDPPDLIWMDIRMPGMDGHEVAETIRREERRRRNEDDKGVHTPIIGFTAGAMENMDAPSLRAAFDDWVYKPFRETEIFDKLEKHLGVQFVYRSPLPAAVPQEETRNMAAATPVDFSVLPPDWLREFSQMVKKERSNQLLKMIDQIRPDHSDLAHRLAEFVLNYQYDKLIPLIQEALNENGNG
jgi:CheY-like chemotaxis protein